MKVKERSIRHILLLIYFISCVGSVYSNSLRLPKYENPTGNEFPIVAWYSFSNPSQVTTENFRIMREAGFNITNTQTDNNIVDLTLKAVEGTGVKVLINCASTKILSSIPDAVRKFRDNPNMMGYFCKDEPTASQFANLKKVVELIYEYDGKHIPFVNFLPVVSPTRLETKDYKSYLVKGVTEIGLPMFSYDNYPVIKKRGRITISDTFYENLEIAAEVSKELSVPFWAFCLSTSHLDYPNPTVAELSFEAFSNLAYGAQGLSYYTYVRKTDHKPAYHMAPVQPDGKKTVIWDYVKKVNGEIRNLQDIFLGCKLKGAWHTGKEIPKGTKRLQRLPQPFISLNTGNEGVLVSQIEKDNKEFLVIVNHSVTAKQNISLTSSKVMMRHYGDGKIIEFGFASSWTLEPGAYAIFSIKQQ